MKWQQECVEQLVAPLPLREAARERLREELWGHLSLTYEAELARAGDEEAAQYAACQRLGDGAALAQEFARGFSWTARLEGRLLQGLTRTQSDGFGLLRRSTPIFVRASLFLFLTCVATMRLPGMTAAAALITWSTGTMALAVGATAVGVAVHELHACLASIAPGAIAKRLAAYVACMVSVAAVAWCCGFGVCWLICWRFDRFDLLQVVDLFGREVMLRALMLSVVLAPASAWAFLWQEHRARQLPNWPYLNLRGKS